MEEKQYNEKGDLLIDLSYGQGILTEAYKDKDTGDLYFVSRHIRKDS